MSDKSTESFKRVAFLPFSDQRDSAEMKRTTHITYIPLKELPKMHQKMTLGVCKLELELAPKKTAAAPPSRTKIAQALPRWFRWFPRRFFRCVTDPAGWSHGPLGSSAEALRGQGRRRRRDVFVFCVFQKENAWVFCCVFDSCLLLMARLQEIEDKEFKKEWPRLLTEAEAAETPSHAPSFASFLIFCWSMCPVGEENHRYAWQPDMSFAYLSSSFFC